MKKVFLLISVFCILYSGASSQNQNLNSAVSYFEDYSKYNELKSLPLAKEKIDLAAANEATMGKAKTWYYRGKIYHALFDNNLKNEMTKSTEADVNKKIVSAYNVLNMTELDEALKSYEKAITLDDKKIYADEMKSKIRVVANNYSDKAYAGLVNKNYTDAISYYEKSYEMRLKMNITDTAAVNNMAIASMKLKDYKKAEGYYLKLIEMKYKPEKCFLSMIQMYTDAGDTASTRSMIMKSRATLPESYPLLIEEINLYLKNNKSEQAIASINKALDKNPNNHELHLALGQTYNKMAFPRDAANKEMPKPANFTELAKKAEDGFSKALSIKPDYTIGLYSLGIFYNNLGAEYLKTAENMKDPAKIKAEENKADDVFKKAIPILEKAHELDPTDKDTMRTLRQLYARTGQGDTEKYKKLNELLKSGK